jgi:hypothetical protein
MNHTGDTSRTLFVDSKNRNVTLFPNGNSYVLHLTTPIKNVARVDLVSARVPNTMYNLTNGANIFTKGVSTTVSLNPGFYSAYTLAAAVTADGTLTLDYLANEGRMVFSSSNPFTLTINSTEFAAMVGLTTGTLYNIATTATVLDPGYTGKYIQKSVTLVDFSLNEYVFLDIEELRTPWNLDAKSIDSNTGTFSGSNSTRMFAPVVMDVGSGCIKNFHENKDYLVQATYPEPISSLQRLTIRWYDKTGNLLDFKGWNTNAFVLRLHVTDLEDRHLPPVQPLQDVEIRRIVEAMTIAAPPPPKPQKRRIPWALIILAILGIVLAWKNRPVAPVPLQRTA